MVCPMSNERTSRKQFVAAAGTAAMVAATTQRAASQTPAAQTERPLLVARNVVEQYPKPPFPEQSQPWPGLVADMQPRPDHGETSYVGSGRLNGRKALVTGGDSGIGRATAIAFAREGADVAINYLPAEEPDAREVVRLIRESGRNAVPIAGDIRSEAFCYRLVDEAASRLDGLDILANIAGRQHAIKKIEDMTTEDFDWTLKTNAYALFWITKAALRHMKPGSSIINTASEQAYDPSDYLLDYAPTKAFIANYTKALAKQLVDRGIRVNAVAPGPIWTPLQISGGRLPGSIGEFGETVPYHRAGQPVEMAPVYVTLASNDMSYASGQVFGANAGKGVP